MQERNKLAKAFLSVAYYGTVDDFDSYDEVVKLINKIERRADSITKKEDIRELIQDNREESTVSYPVIFYACDEHSNCADDHLAYQGKIYIDRYWRSKFEWPEWMRLSIERYIREHGTVSIQRIMGPPVWLGTRPYCKHKFYSLDTLTVLTRDPNSLIPHVITHRKSKKKRRLF